MTIAAYGYGREGPGGPTTVVREELQVTVETTTVTVAVETQEIVVVVED